MSAGGGSSGVTGWHTIPIVSGEVSFLSFIRSKDGSLKNGHIARVLDIPVKPETMIVAGPGETSSEKSDHLKEMCLEYHGAAFKSFVDDFIHTSAIQHGWLDELKIELKHLAQEYRDKVQRPHEKRAAEHFSVIQYAGKLAVCFGVLPFSEQDIASSVEVAFEAWKSGLEDKDELDYAVDDLRVYMSSMQPSFINPDSDTANVRHIGYKFTQGGVECLAFEEPMLDGVLDGQH